MFFQFPFIAQEGYLKFLKWNKHRLIFTAAFVISYII